MIKELTMYGAVCDHCKKQWEDPEHGWVAVEDKESLVTILADEGWIVDEGDSNNVDEIYCMDCYYFDDDDSLALRVERKDKYLKE